MKFRLLLLMLFCGICVSAQDIIPCMGTTTTSLNVRSGPGKEYSRIDLLERGREVKVLYRENNGWLYVEYGVQTGYVHPDYLTFSPLPQPKEDRVERKSGNSSWLWSIVKMVIWIVVSYLAVLLIFNISARILFLYLRLVRFVSMIFFPLNWLQRFLQKPWYLLLKWNRFDDSTNKTLRIVSMIVKIPLYILCTPLRFVNAVFYNLFIHCVFEMYNYSTEVLYPSSDKEGEDNPRAIHLLMWRILKYPLWHGMLTIVESVIWTVLDTIIPALTLYHGTSYCATANIVSSPNRLGDNYYSDVGIWVVGGGNFAGNGIYFASALRTAKHYSGNNAIIVCRVTLGRILDLGLAPRYVYRECGNANALNATRWGLKHGYTTGEWWRADEAWWEFCMYDWQNRYNESWRIRPLYIIDATDNNIERIPGGMHHWFFRGIVIKDIIKSIFG